MSELAIRRGAAPALAVEGLTYSYPEAARPALDAVSLEVAPGEFVLLAGRSASGKSTLLKAACGLVPHFHGGEIEGRVAVAGLDAIEAGPGELASAVGYLAQDPETQVVSTTVAAEIELPLELRGDPPTDRARAVEEVALALAIPHLLGRTVDTLSGGELQRVALAAALVTRPSLVLLDEPTSQLDPVAGDELIWLLRRLNEEWGVAVLLAEHRLERCLAAADRVVAMASAAIAFDGAPAEFLAWAQLADPALETPAARLFSLAGIEPLPVGVRAARRSLEVRAKQPGDPAPSTQQEEAAGSPGHATAFPHPGKGGGSGSHPPASAVFSARALWVELEQAERPARRPPGDRPRTAPRRTGRADGPQRGRQEHPAADRRRLDRPGRRQGRGPRGMALLTQSPGDYLVRERVGDELPGAAGAAALRVVGLEHAVEADPRDLSGGERQRLALAIALAGRMDGAQCPAWSPSTSRPAAWTAPARTSSSASSRTSPRRAPASSSPPTTSSSPPSSPSASSCSATAS